MKRSFWWYRPSPVVLFVTALLLAFAFRAFAQGGVAPALALAQTDPVDVSTPPETIVPLLPASWQNFWMYYVVPVFVGVYGLALILSHLLPAGSKAAAVITQILNGGKAAARLTGTKLPEDEKNVALPLQQPGMQATPPAPKPPTVGGFARLGLLATIALSALVLLPACGTFSSAQGTTSKIDLGKDVACTVTLGALDVDTCSKPITTNCEVPEPKDSAGNCSFLSLDTGTLNLGKGYACRATAAESGKPCIALIATTCTTPVPRQPDGTCK